MSTAIPQRVVDRIWERVDVRGPDECWPWKLSIGSHGYGQAGWSLPGGKNNMTTAMRVAWTAANGPIPDGLTVDHLCRNRPCCNPAHLRLLTNEANAGDTALARRTHCVHGHLYDERNTYLDPKGHRRCRACARERMGRIMPAERHCPMCGASLLWTRPIGTKYCSPLCKGRAGGAVRRQRRAAS